MINYLTQMPIEVRQLACKSQEKKSLVEKKMTSQVRDMMRQIIKLTLNDKTKMQQQKNTRMKLMQKQLQA